MKETLSLLHSTTCRFQMLSDNGIFAEGPDL